MTAVGLLPLPQEVWDSMDLEIMEVTLFMFTTNNYPHGYAPKITRQEAVHILKSFLYLGMHKASAGKNALPYWLLRRDYDVDAEAEAWMTTIEEENGKWEIPS